MRYRARRAPPWQAGSKGNLGHAKGRESQARREHDDHHEQRVATFGLSTLHIGAPVFRHLHRQADGRHPRPRAAAAQRDIWQGRPARPERELEHPRRQVSPGRQDDELEGPRRARRRGGAELLGPKRREANQLYQGVRKQV